MMPVRDARGERPPRAVRVDAIRLDRQAATLGHRVTGVHREVDEYLLDLSGIDSHGAQLGRQHRFELDVLADQAAQHFGDVADQAIDRKSTRLNSSHGYISYAVFCLKK